MNLAEALLLDLCCRVEQSADSRGSSHGDQHVLGCRKASPACQGATAWVLTLLHLHCEICWGFPHRTPWLEVDGAHVVLGSVAPVGELVSWKSAPHTHQLLLLQQQHAN